jgi:DNA-binding NtrC family response regulator
MTVEKGEFRSDLFDRIATTVIEIPCLNERKEDIPLIIDFYLKKIFNGHLPVIEKEVYDVLCNREYEGNIRELKNEVHNICMRYSGKGPVTLGDLSNTIFDLPLLNDEVKWYEKTELLELINQAIDEGFELKKIEETIQSIATKITLQRVSRNKDASRILGKSERWIQMQKIKEKNG